MLHWATEVSALQLHAYGELVGGCVIRIVGVFIFFPVFVGTNLELNSAKNANLP